VVATSSVAPGVLGGLRGLVPLWLMIGNIGVTVVLSQVALSNEFNAFSDAGDLNDAWQSQILKATISQLI
jgi:chromate reductase